MKAEFKFMKMVLFRTVGGRLGWVFSLGLLLLLVTVRVSRQQGTRMAAAMFINAINIIIIVHSIQPRVYGLIIMLHG